MKIFRQSVVFGCVIAFLAASLVSCGEEQTISKPSSTTPTTPHPPVALPPAGEQPTVQQPRLPQGVVYFEAEAFDPGKSVVKNGGVEWHVKEDPKAFGGKYIVPTGANRQRVTELIYSVPEITIQGKKWVLWMRVIFPRAAGEAADSFFWDLAPDGKKWRGPWEVIAGEAVPEWQWRGWEMDLGPDKGDSNLFKLLERESDIQIDVICLRADDESPSDEEYDTFLKAEAGGQ